MKTLLLLILLLTSSSLSLVGQTKVWEATSPTTIDYLAISQDGSTLASLSKGSLYVWRKDSNSYVKFVTLNFNSPPVISKNNDTVYCLGIVNSIHGIYVVPLHDDTVYFRPLKELPNNLNGGLFTVNPTFRFLQPTHDSLSLLFGYSYTVITITSATFSRGRVGILKVDGVQTKELVGEVVEQLSSNISTNHVIASGKSQDVPQRSTPTVNPYTKAISLTTNKAVLSLPSYFSSVSVCHDTNYIILDHSLYHVPTGDYVRNLTTPETGNYHSCSDNYDFYITVKGDSLFVLRYDDDTPILTIHCEGKISACQLSADSRRIVVVTNSKLLTVYNLPEVQQAKLHADFTSDYTSTYKGGSIQFRNNSYITDSKYQVLWEFGDGDTSSLLHPKHVYSSPGIYSVRLKLMTSRDTSEMLKVKYINYKDLSKPTDALWSKKYTNGWITSLAFVKDSIFAGTNDGSVFSVMNDGRLGKYLLEHNQVSYQIANDYQNQIGILHYKDIVYNQHTNNLYVLGVPKGTSAFTFIRKITLDQPSVVNKIEVGKPGFMFGNYPNSATFYETNSTGGFPSLALSYDSLHIHYSNFGKASFLWSGGIPPNNTISGESIGCYSGTLTIENDSILYDNGRSPYIGTYPVNPLYLKGSDALCNLNVYSIRGGLPYNSTSYFIIANNSVHHIRYGTFDLIAKYPTKGTILRHSPDQYHSFTSDGVWSFADGKRIDSLPLLSARRFEVFPDGVHLLVMYPKSDTVAIFNTLTKKYMQYFKANFIISSIAIAKDGKSFATGDTSGIVTLWQTPKLSITKKIEFIAPQSDKNKVKGDTVQFFNTSIPVNSGCRYEWDFGDGTTSNERLPKHVYGKAGKYTVTLKTYCPPETGVDSTVDVLEKAAYITVTDTVTSVEGQVEMVHQSYLSITPNPLVHQGLITVNFPKHEQYSLRIITLLGQEILLAEDALSSHEEYTIPQLPRGVYSCQLRFGNGEIIYKPFVVRE